MTDRAWIIGELERLVNELKKNPIAAQGGGGAPAPAAPASLGAWKKAKCTFWAVEEKISEKSGKAYCKARIGLSWIEDGESKSCFLSTLDRKLIESIDPVNKGDRVEYQTERSGQYENLTALRVVG
jgi:hypothetical protein